MASARRSHLCFGPCSGISTNVIFSDAWGKNYNLISTRCLVHRFPVFALRAAGPAAFNSLSSPSRKRRKEVPGAAAALVSTRAGPPGPAGSRRKTGAVGPAWTVAHKSLFSLTRMSQLAQLSGAGFFLHPTTCEKKRNGINGRRYVVSKETKKSGFL